MTIQRVTSMSGGATMVAALQANYSRLTQLQQQISSGKQVQRPSDDPAQVLTALDYRGQLRRADQLGRNIDDATGWLGTADSTLGTAETYLQRARDLTVQAQNGSSDAGARAAISQEILSLRDGLIQLANSKYQNRPIFSGTVDVNTQAYSAAGAYQGNAGTVNRNIAPGVTVPVNLTGPQVFGANNAVPYSGDTFQILTQLANDVQTGNWAGANTGLTAIDTATSRIQQAIGAIGAREQRVDDVKARNADVNLQLKSALADAEDIDLPKTLIDLQSQQMAYQAALGVTAKVIQPSLLDFLR